MTHRLFPLFADLPARRVLVVGAGAVAARKLAALVDTGADIVVGARDIGGNEVFDVRTRLQQVVRFA